MGLDLSSTSAASLCEWGSVLVLNAKKEGVSKKGTAMDLANKNWFGRACVC